MSKVMLMMISFGVLVHSYWAHSSRGGFKQGSCSVELKKSGDILSGKSGLVSTLAFHLS